ncbi:hypothetical protein DFJ73DRAFT_657386 [Zopfochytrium polystomum]|nr:hypothetical protein DFJ73DRAFT_657386 [Zopfochytrium polystomum]
MSQLFRILASPVRSPVATTSSPLMASKLDPDYLAHLKSSMSRILASKQQRRARKGGSLALVEEEGESAVSMEDILRVIDVNSLLRRPKEAQKAFDMIKTATGVNPGLEAYNGLMDAYANVGDIKNAAQIFQRIRISKSMQPDVVSFSILIKACVTGLDLAGAFKVYNNMKQRGIAPNLPIYTTLIKGCIKSDDLPRAWKTFDHLRTEVVEPDSVVYTLMLHACARAGEAERALSLFKEMLERGWVPSDVTYNSLIQACGSRPDYYHEAWSLVEQMRRDGFAPSRWTFNVLLGVAATGHDLVRARKIWNEMQEVAGLVPDYFSFQKMFKALSSARQANRTIRKDLHFARRMGRQIPAMKPDSEDDLHLVTGGTTSVFDDLDMSTESGSSDSARPKGPPTDSQIAKLGAPMLLFDCKDPSFHAAVLDADRLKDYLVTLHYFFEDKGTSSSATEGTNLTASRPMPKVLRTGKTFRLALGTVCRDKMALRSDADRIWQKFLAWDTLMESRFGKKKKTEEEREALRMMEGRGRKSVATSFINMINGMARLDKISEALRLLERTRSFRYPFYLPQVFYRDIEVLVEKIRELSEAGNVKPLRKLQALCPPATALPTEAVGSGDRLIEVQKALRLKSIGKKWWGWEAIGVDQRQQALERRRITKEKERIQQYWDSKRK